MTRKVKHTEENVYGFTWHDGKPVPYWKDDVPQEVQLLNENEGKNVTSLTMAGAPRPVTPPKPSGKQKEAAHGEGYFEGRLQGRPDLQRRVHNLVQKYGERIDAVDADFASKFGWEVSRTHVEVIEEFLQNYLTQDAVEQRYPAASPHASCVTCNVRFPSESRPLP